LSVQFHDVGHEAQMISFASDLFECEELLSLIDSPASMLRAKHALQRIVAHPDEESEILNPTPETSTKLSSNTVIESPVFRLDFEEED